MNLFDCPSPLLLGMHTESVYTLYFFVKLYIDVLYRTPGVLDAGVSLYMLGKKQQLLALVFILAEVHYVTPDCISRKF